jgi:hypothetical protein
MKRARWRTTEALSKNALVSGAEYLGRGFGYFPPRLGRLGVALAVGKFGLFEQPIYRGGAAPLKVLGRDPPNIGAIPSHGNRIPDWLVIGFNAGQSQRGQPPALSR